MLLITLTAGVLAASPGTFPELRSGDIVLQANHSGMSDAIQRATSSPYSHVGIVEVTAQGAYVIEAIDPVSRTPFDRWRTRGTGGHLTIMRPHVEGPQIVAALAWARSEIGKPYDTRYAWDDDNKVYCSELVVKAYEHGAHIELGRKVRLDALKLSQDERALAALAGVPLSREVVPPGTLASDPQLELVYSDMQ